MDYVASLPKDGRLFPDLKPVAYSKRFGRLLLRVGLDDPNLVFHSFRHTFKDACRAAGIAEEVHDRLTGHAGAGGIGRRYGEGVPLKVLAEAVQKISYPRGVLRERDSGGEIMLDIPCGVSARSALGIPCI